MEGPEWLAGRALNRQVCKAAGERGQHSVGSPISYGLEVTTRTIRSR
jgi:hypothetical protein